MKRLLLTIALLAVTLSVTASAQVFDGIPQPTTFRLRGAVTHTFGSDAGFMDAQVKIPLAEQHAVVLRGQYNVPAGSYFGQLWYSLNLLEKRLWLLPVASYNSNEEFSAHLWATYKLGDWQFNTTIANVDDFDPDAGGYAQVSAGYKFGRFFILLPGVVVLNDVRQWNPFVNLRVMVTKYTWLQGRFEHDIERGDDRIALVLFTHFDTLFE